MNILIFSILFCIFNAVLITSSLSNGTSESSISFNTSVIEVHHRHLKHRTQNSKSPYKTEIYHHNYSCRPQSEEKCTLVFSRHQESDEEIRWLRFINKNIKKIVMNSGKAVANNHNFCEHRVWANVGREAFKYLTYILENYHKPENFAPITVFCQISPEAPGYTIPQFIDNVHNLCLRNGTPNMLRWGFLYLGYYALEFSSGLGAFPSYDYLTDFKSVFNSTIKGMLFVPQGCFAVSKENILSNTMEYYENLLTTGNLNTENNPLIGHVYERSWPRIMNSECEKKSQWCCYGGCNSTLEAWS